MNTLRPLPRPNTRHTFYSLNLRQLGHLPRPALTQKQWSLVIGAGVYAGFFVYCVVSLFRIILSE
jgi:hypothetical protein